MKKSLLALASLTVALTLGPAAPSAAVPSVPSFKASERYLVPRQRSPSLPPKGHGIAVPTYFPLQIGGFLGSAEGAPSC
jgi:hypothetical protein